MRLLGLNPNLKQIGNIIKGTLKVVEHGDSDCKTFLEVYSFYESVSLDFTIKHHLCSCGEKNEYVAMVMFKLYKISKDDNLSYGVKLNSRVLDLGFEFKLKSDDKDVIHWSFSTKQNIQEYDIEVVVKIFAKPSSFASLYDDEELTDFELRGSDGSVSVHRAVLAASSPVLRRMLAGPWKEAKQGHVDISNTTQHTLQVLKDFVYLGKLPDEVSVLRALLLLAKCYMIVDLETLCLKKLRERIHTADVVDLMEFSIVNKLNKLTMIIFNSVKDQTVNLERVAKQLENAKIREVDTD